MVEQRQNPIHRLFNTKRLFFSLASLWAAVAPLLFLCSLQTTAFFNINLSEHGRGLLIGFTSALITGYLAGKRPAYEVWWLVLLWCSTRLVEILSDQTILSNWLYGIYGVHLAILIAPRFWASKKIRNWLMSPVLGVLLCFPLLILFLYSQSESHNWVFVFIQLLALLMFFMAGRMIVPLLSKTKRASQLPMQSRVQPLLEGWTMGLFLLSIILRVSTTVSDIYFYRWLLIINYFLLAIIICIRVIRWQPQGILSKDYALTGLLLGYFWLAVAQLVFAIDVIQQQVNIKSLHLVTVGALGLNSSVIMSLAVAKRTVIPQAILITYLVAISGATMSRFLAGIFPSHYMPLLWISASLWCLNYLLVLIHINSIKKVKR